MNRNLYLKVLLSLDSVGLVVLSTNIVHICDILPTTQESSSAYPPDQSQPELAVQSTSLAHHSASMRLLPGCQEEAWLPSKTTLMPSCSNTDD